jgi:hypothetical protein
MSDGLEVARADMQAKLAALHSLPLLCRCKVECTEKWRVHLTAR